LYNPRQEKLMQRRSFLRPPVAALLAAAMGVTLAPPALAATAYTVHALVSDGSVPADHTDPNLKNPWGVAFNPVGFVWVANNHTGTSTLYDGAGVPQSLVVTVPAAASVGTGSPTGIVFSGSEDFIVGNGTTEGPSRFIFCTEDGTISGWAPNVDLNNAIIAASTPGASYRGLAIAATPKGNMLFAADFVNGRVDAFDAQFTPVTTDGDFVNPLLHFDYAPFNIQAIGDQLYIAYAKRNKEGDDEQAGKTKGFVDVFDFDGHFVRRLIKHRGLNAPWGFTMAPEGFGDFGGSLLVGNFGNGTIAAYNPKTGRFRGYLKDAAGEKLRIEGLWGMAFGNGVNGQDENKLYFAAGVEDEEGGLYGSVSAGPSLTPAP
jgi:uncharacterized protein (TIGR03118 family)